MPQNVLWLTKNALQKQWTQIQLHEVDFGFDMPQNFEGVVLCYQTSPYRSVTPFFKYNIWKLDFIFGKQKCGSMLDANVAFVSNITGKTQHRIIKPLLQKMGVCFGFRHYSRIIVSSFTSVLYSEYLFGLSANWNFTTRNIWKRNIYKEMNSSTLGYFTTSHKALFTKFTEKWNSVVSSKSY